jgi:hypothetical protein
LVLKVDQESETIAQAGAPILEIGDPLDLEIVVDVLSINAVAIRPGAEVLIENWGGQGTLEGRVHRIEPAAFTKISTLGVEEQRVNVLVDVTSPAEKWRGLGDAYRVDTRIAVFSQENATIVPGTECSVIVDLAELLGTVLVIGHRKHLRLCEAGAVSISFVFTCPQFGNPCQLYSSKDCFAWRSSCWRARGSFLVSSVGS